MGISCKPVGKMASVMRKVDNQIAKEKAEKVVHKTKKRKKDE